MSDQYDYGLYKFADLRKFCEYDDEDCECPVCDAIFEIQGLKNEVSKWRVIAERFAESNAQFDAFHSYFREVFES